jgi:F-type H+-transporting ATPase subunit epsilon
MAKLNFRIATPERVVYESEVEQVTCMTQMGEVTILPNHIPLVATLVPGELKVIETGSQKYMSVAGGFLEVRPNNEVVILADAAEHAEEIDLARAEEARKRAKELMKEPAQGGGTIAEAQALLERSLARIKVGKRRKYKDVGRRP